MSKDFAPPTVALEECAVVVNAADNVAVVKCELGPRDRVTMADGGVVEITATVTPGHRFATRAIAEGDCVLQYGQPIGTSCGIELGDPITPENMSNEVPVVRDLPDDLSNPEPDYFSDSECATFQGFRRPDGRVGTRNHLLVIPTSMCASHEAQQIATVAEFTRFDRERFPNVDSVVAIPHNKGCGTPDGSNLDVMMRTLASYADHPNVGAAIFIDLGCEKTNLDTFRSYLASRGGLSW